MKRITLICAMVCACLFGQAQTLVHIADIDSWRYTDMQKYVGQTVTFDVPFYVCNNYNGLTISPRRTFSPTNQAYPLSNEYDALLSANAYGSVSLSGISDYHRCGEQIIGLTVTVTSTNKWTASGPQTFSGNTRADILATDVRSQLTAKDGTEPGLVVCGANLEYFLVANLGSGSMGPSSRSEAQEQRNKVRKALSLIRADLYGFVEIEQGTIASDTLARMMTAITGQTYASVADGSSPNGTYTKSGYVYNTQKLEPIGRLVNNNQVVQNRKKLQAFREKSTGEIFIFSINHFKAKSGTGTGANADQGDGQGIYNSSRVQEARSVLDYYNNHSGTNNFGDPDILIMGDLNAYAKEDPITVLVDGGMTDLHRYFHADSSYSYTFHGQAGYLDHALCNNTLLPQVTGMLALHINSDEDDKYTYNGNRNDGSMFRYSDHDPVIVGLKLDAHKTPIDPLDNHANVTYVDGHLRITDAEGGYYTTHTLNGVAMTVDYKHIGSSDYCGESLAPGLYIINVYANTEVKHFKIFVR